MHRSWLKNSLFVFVALVLFTSGYLAHAAKKADHLRNALDFLLHAKHQLGDAKGVFGKHRQKAVTLTEEAIKETKAGIESAKNQNGQ